MAPRLPTARAGAAGPTAAFPMMGMGPGYRGVATQRITERVTPVTP